MKRLDEKSVYGEILKEGMKNGSLSDLISDNLKESISNDLKNFKKFFKGNSQGLANKKAELYNKKGKEFFESGNVFTKKDIEDILDSNIVTPKSLEKEIRAVANNREGFIPSNGKDNSFVGMDEELWDKNETRIEKNMEIISKPTVAPTKSLSQKNGNRNTPKPTLGGGNK